MVGGVVRDNSLYRADHIAVVKGLGDVVDRAHAHGIYCRAQACIAGHNQDGHFTGLLDEVCAGRARQAQVTDNQIK